MASMADAVNEMNGQGVWDDSALVQSWNEALAEYKKYHSIHATGRSLDGLLLENEQRAKPETQLHDQHTHAASQPVAGEANEAVVNDQRTNADVAVDGAATIKDRVDGNESVSSGQNDASHGALGQSQGMEHASASIMPPPQALLGSVQDEDLKKLLMSWYYAGFYTGLYEGQQKHRN